GRLHRHPRTGRGGERFGVRPPDPKDYLREEFVAVFRRLEQLGFTQAQLQAGALELLHEEEWATAAAPTQGAPTTREQPSTLTGTSVPQEQQPGLTQRERLQEIPQG